MRREQYLLDSAHHGLAMNPSGDEAVRGGHDVRLRGDREPPSVRVQAHRRSARSRTGRPTAATAALLRLGQRRRPRLGDLLPDRPGGRAHPGRRPPAADAHGRDPPGLRAVGLTRGRLVSRREAGPARWHAVMPTRIAAIVAAGLVGLFSLGLLAAGGASLLWGDSQKDEQGYLSTATERFATTTYAMATEKLDVDLDGRRLGLRPRPLRQDPREGRPAHDRAPVRRHRAHGRRGALPAPAPTTPSSTDVEYSPVQRRLPPARRRRRGPTPGRPALLGRLRPRRRHPDDRPGRSRTATGRSWS